MGLADPDEGRSVRRNPMDMGRRSSLPVRMASMGFNDLSYHEVRRELAPIHSLSELQSQMAAYKAKVAARKAQQLPSLTPDGSSNGSDTKMVDRRASLTALHRMHSTSSISESSTQDGLDSRSLSSASTQDTLDSVGGRVNGSRKTRSASVPDLSASVGGLRMSAGKKNVSALVEFLHQAKRLSELSLRGLAKEDRRGLMDIAELARSLRGYGCMLPTVQLHGLLRSASSEVDGKRISFEAFYNMVATQARSMGYGEEVKEQQKTEVKLAFELGSRVKSLVELSWKDSEYENELGTVEGPGPTSATIAVRFDLTNEIRFMRPSQLEKVTSRRNTFALSTLNRRRTIG